MISSVVRCPSNMVMVFDEDGEQLPEYQGMYPEVRAHLMEQAPPGTVFGHWYDSEADIVTIPREAW
ncbi:MAG: hypothetical protein V1780_00435 [Chloroflexota bacterium]